MRNLIGNEMRRLEYVLDVFKGTCILNNYTPLLTPMKGEELKNSLETGKYFYYKLQDTENITFLALLVGLESTYRTCELINLGLKTLNNMGIYSLEVNIDTEDDKIIEDLEAMDIEVVKYDSKKDTNTLVSFSYTLDDKTLGTGAIKKDGFAYAKIDYNSIKDICDYHQENRLDCLLVPKDEDVLEDALIISTNLRDGGFGVEVDYEHNLENDVSIQPDFIITFDKDDIKKYIVHLKDTKTNETKEINLDQIVEELSFF